MKYNLILGSGSPRRSQLLKSMELKHSIIKPQNKEIIDQHSPPLLTVNRLAKEKMEWLLDREPLTKQCWLLTADTLVYIEKAQYGKPKNKAEAKEMLVNLSGNKHFVTTSLFLRSPRGIIKSIDKTTEVYFKIISPELLAFYLSRKDWKDAAGAYKIQSAGDLVIDKIIGSFSNVMGLPIGELYDIMTFMGFF